MKARMEGWEGRAGRDGTLEADESSTCTEECFETNELKVLY